MQSSILVVDDESAVRWSLAEALSETGYKVEGAESGEEALSMIDHSFPDLMLLDICLPKSDGITVLKHAKEKRQDLITIMITAHGAVETAVEAMKLGAYDYIDKPFDLDELRLLIAKALETISLKKEVRRLREQQKGKIVYQSRVMEEICSLIDRISATDSSTVLIQGESGTGKELVARAVHYGSARADKPFVAVNCTALPEHLLESELFGHEKGAFTDAKGEKTGLFELADAGTLFLDEIGDMGHAMQAKLLRALEERTFRRIGSTKDIRVDIRVIASTNRDLQKAMESGEFRSDLYYRLMVVPVHLPPLAERKEDILPLAKYFVDEFNHQLSRQVCRIADEVATLLESHTWPGNVRELRNTIERAMILGTGEELCREHLMLWQQKESAAASSAAPGTSPLCDAEKEFIQETLESLNWNKNLAAKVLQINRTTLYKKIKKYELAPDNGDV